MVDLLVCVTLLIRLPLLQRLFRLLSSHLCLLCAYPPIRELPYGESHQLPNNYLLRSYYVSSIFLDSGSAAMSKTDNSIYILKDRQDGKKKHIKMSNYVRCAKRPEESLFGERAGR